MRVDALVEEIDTRRIQVCLIILGADETIDEKSAVGRRRIGTDERNLRGAIELTSADVHSADRIKRRERATEHVASGLRIAGGRAQVHVPAVNVEPRNVGAELDTDKILVDGLVAVDRGILR